MTHPPTAAEAAFLSGSSTLTRRIEIWESDGVTRWVNGDNDNVLISGGVSVDYTRDERRSVDLELDNSEWKLKHSPSGFWYDKIIKVFSGIKYIDTTPADVMEIVTNYVSNPKSGVNNNGFLAGLANQTVSRITGEVTPVGTTVSRSAYTAAAPKNTGLTYNNFGAGSTIAPGVYSYSAWIRCSKAQVFSVGFQVLDSLDAPLFYTVDEFVVVDANTWTLVKLNNMVIPQNAFKFFVYFQSSSASVGSTTWVTGDNFDVAGQCLVAGATYVTYFDGNTTPYSGRSYWWSGTVEGSISNQQILFQRVQATSMEWETQVGEFMLDSISEAHFPYIMKIAGRDYTKKCLLSKYSVATSYGIGTPIEAAIKSIAQAAGITKFILPVTTQALGKDYFFDRGTARWDAMKQISEAFGYEMFFDAQGYLVIREYLDPMLAPFCYRLQTGPLGNLVSFSKASNDTQIYNHVVVVGASSDTTVLPVWAEAINTEPSSPTRVAKLGDRVFEYQSEFITTTLQAQDVANKFLKIHGLEAFDLGFAAIAMPWLEVGEILEFLEPRQVATDPKRFLLTAITIPLDLGPMSGTAKRVTVVG